VKKSVAAHQLQSVLFRPEGLFRKLIGAMLVWLMVMSSLPMYAADLKETKWDSSSSVGQTLPAQKTQAAVGAATSQRQDQVQTRSARVFPRPLLASLHPYTLASSHTPVSFPLMLQTTASLLQVSVGFADSTSASANFPEPWNEKNPLVNFFGTGTTYRAGAIRLDNPTGTDILVDTVTVDLGRPGPVFQLWTNVSIPAFGSAILTQTQDGNFNTSASPIVGCGQALATNESRVPKITISVGGTPTDYMDTAHVLDTGGFDSSCRGNQSLEWRPIGTAGIESPSGTVQLIDDNAPHAVGTQNTVNVLVNDAASQPLANAAVTLNVVNGPNAGTSLNAVTDTNGSATIQYSSAQQGTDLLQAVVKNASGGALQSQQVSTTWTSAAACPLPSAPNAAATRLIYVGQNTNSFGNLIRLAGLLTDGAGVPLSGRTMSFAFGTQTLTATTDANGLATVLVSLPVGQTAVTLTFAGDQAFQPVQLNTTVSILRAATLLRYTGNALIGSIGPQTVSALLTDSLGHTAVANRPVTFTLNGLTATGITDANGLATATLNFAASQPSGAAQLQIAFAGDASYLPSTRTAAVQIYQTMPFVVWGGNTGGLKIGQRVNFWGSQWESQVINAQNYASNSSFKGWADSINIIQQCQASATPATLTPTCWQVKPGQSFPPDMILPSYIEVIVSTVINKSGDTVFGNIACGAVVQVDHTPPYGAVPGQPGFGTISSVNGDCAGVFPKPAVITASQQQANPVLPGQQVGVNYSITNSGATDATGVALNETFDQVTPATGSANLGTIAAGTTASGNFSVTIPVITARQQTESTVDYESRLAASDGKLFTSTGEISFSDVFSQIYTPVAISSFSQLILPRLALGLSGATCVAPGASVAYQVKVDNLGSATAEKITATLTQPDSSTSPVVVPDLASGTSFASTVNWKAPGVAAKDPAESTQAYLSRLQSFDGTVLPPAVISASWQDHLANSYGPIEQSFFSLTQRVPIISVLTPPAQSLLPNQKVQLPFTASNIGSGNAVQVTLTLKRPDGSTFILPNFSLPGGQNATVSAGFTAPAVAAKGATETDADYLNRLLTANGSVLNLNTIAAWTDSVGNNYGPTGNPFTLSEKLPVLQLSASTTPAAVLPGQTATLNLAVQNAGSADAQKASFTITNPDGTTASPASFTVPAGQSNNSSNAFAVVPLAAKGASESDSAYLTRLGSFDNKSLSFNAALSWADAIPNSYGPISAQAQASEQLPILNIALAAPATANSGDTITYTVTLTNVGHAAASQVSGTIILPNGTQQPLTATTIPAGASVQSTFAFAIPDTQPTSTITTTANVSWNDAVPNAYGSIGASASIQVTQPNLPPVVNAGPDQTVPFPNVLPLQGSVTDDGKPVGGTLVATWTQVSGPSPAIFANPHDPKTTVTLNAQGVYVLKLTGDDSQLQASSTVTITTIPGNKAPVVTVGPAQTITLPVNTANLTGSATDDGLPVGSTLSFQWTRISGPAPVTFGNAASPSTTASFSQAGTYLLRLSASDSQLTGSADVQVTVVPHNNPPVANAGPNQTIFLPITTATLAGTATDDGLPAGSTLTTQWSVFSGSGSVTFADLCSAPDRI
jgi:uncharacterized repeat protein (TIGR01451 family)